MRVRLKLCCKVLLLVQLPIALSGCDVLTEISLAEAVLTALIGSAASEVAAPVIKPFARSIHAILGIRETASDDSNIAAAATEEGLDDWRGAFGGIRFGCRGGTTRACELKAKAEAEDRAAKLANRFLRAYSDCTDIANGGNGNFGESVAQIEACTSGHGFEHLMAAIIRRRGAQL